VRRLLDTHAMYWYIEDDPQSSGPARTLIHDASNEMRIIPTSYWEITINGKFGDLLAEVKAVTGGREEE